MAPTDRVRQILSWYASENPGTQTNLVRLAAGSLLRGGVLLRRRVVAAAGGGEGDCDSEAYDRASRGDGAEMMPTNGTGGGGVPSPVTPTPPTRTPLL